MNETEAPPSFCNQAEFGRLQGWSKAYVTKLKHEGRLVFGDDGMVDVQASLELIRGSTSAPERASAPAVGTVLQQLQAQEKRLDIQRKEREEQTAVGELLERRQVLDAVSDAAVTLRTKFEAWPKGLSPQIAALGADEARIEAFLAEQVEQAFSELSAQFARVGAQR